MTRRTAWYSGFAIPLLLLLVPAEAFAQSGIAGTARDATGGVLPGVTVEASSPALIEKARAAITDAAGLYSIVDLRPGVYTVTFTLAGFATVRREGVELPSSFTATVNAEMRVGAIEETITVLSQAPLVDVQSITKATVFSNELLDNLPAVRLPQSYVPYLPGVQGAIIGAQHTQSNTLAIHGGRTGEYQTAIDGTSTRFAWGGGGPGTSYYMMTAIIEDLSIELGGLTAEHQAGGIFANVIPKEGSNAFSGFFFASYTDNHLQGNNLTDDLRGRGLTSVPGNQALWDINPAFGGRILRDRLWFYSSVRRAVNNQFVAGEYYNKTPLAWTYTPDLTRPVVNKNSDTELNTRLTWQVTPKNKVSAYLSIQPHYVYFRNLPRGPGPRITPEATSYTTYYPNSFGQVIWKSPVSTRLLLEAAVGRHMVDYNNLHPSDPSVSPDTWAALELSTNMRFRSIYPIGTNSGAYGHHPIETFSGRTSASYVTGSHVFKAGLDYFGGSYKEWGLHSNGDILVTLLNGVPRSVTLVANPLDNEQNVNADLGIFAQDRWTLNRLTLSAGLRFDYFNSSVPAQSLPAGRWVPAREYAAVRDVPNWKDVSPRFGVSYDLLGDGKTVLKGFAGRYVAALGAINIAAPNNPVNTAVTNVARTWTDANQDYVPNCDLLNPDANGECGRFSDVNFGKANSRASRYDEGLLRGYGKRGYNWETSASLQRQVSSGISADVSYYRRWYGNFTLTDNLAVSAVDHDPFCIVAPTDQRLPGGGGQEICGLYDINPAKFGQINNLITLSDPFGRQREVYDGLDLTVSARFGRGGQLSGGLNTGRTKTNKCFVVDSPGELRFCDVAPPFETQVKFVGSYPLPLWGLQFSGVLQSVPGPQILADYPATNAQIRPTLGRDLAAGPNGTVLVPLIGPGTLYGPRMHQVDLRFTKNVKVGRTRVRGNVDVFNILNGNAVQFLNTRLGPTWLQPMQIQGARYVQFSAQLEF